MSVKSVSGSCFSRCHDICEAKMERHSNYSECMRKCEESEGGLMPPQANLWGGATGFKPSRLWVGYTVLAMAAGDKDTKEPAPKESPAPKEKNIVEKIYDKIVPDAH